MAICCTPVSDIIVCAAADDTAAEAAERSIPEAPVTDAPLVAEALTARPSEGEACGAAIKKPGIDTGAPTLAYMGWCMAAPTLIYQHAFPLAKKRSPARMAWLATHLALCVLAGLPQVAQRIAPALSVVLGALDAGDSRAAASAYLELTASNFAGWLLLFLGVFHSGLDLAAEATRFADREVYKRAQAWWDAATLRQFWGLWNKLAHHWLLRTVCTPAASLR
ncbi:hypothetical protein WJX81_003802 [Elliptochloris bilobata]|uniref:diacylglycerol O-acyltransferase n=1 Tax=Elliptochloris bilobata TaxID=381761 RepID=A0AAW1SI44_9CHLO